MWIIPKQLHTSASALDTKALGLDSEEFSQICERSLTWRGKDSLSRTWLQRWKRENWMQHLCTRTLKPSLTGSFVDAWTSSLADSRANHSVLPESVTALKTLDTCSLTSQTESESANLELFSSKTLKESSQPRQQTGNQFCNMSSESWKAWVIEQRREYSVRLKSAHLTRESGSSSLAWPTASARDWKDTAGMSKARDGKALGRVDQLPRAVYHHDGLLDQANLSTNGKSQESQQWPTPNTSDQYNPNIPHDLGRGYLRTEVLMNKKKWPTPRANKVHPVITEENREQLANRKKANLEEEIAGHCGKAQGKLNPDWVESLMGLPTGWTDFDFSEME